MRVWYLVFGRKGRDEWDGVEKGRGREKEKWIPLRWQPVQRVFGRLALTVGPRIHLRRYRGRFRPTRGPTPTNSGPTRQRTLPPVLAAHNSLQPRPSNVIYGGTRGHEGEKKARSGKRSRWKRGGGRTVLSFAPLVHPSARCATCRLVRWMEGNVVV